MRTSSLFLSVLAIAACAAGATCARRAGAAPAEDTPAAPSLPPSRSSRSLLSRLGTAPAEVLLSSESPDERLRGVERLVGLATPSAVDRLLDAVSPGGVAATDARARLEAVRGLVSFASRNRARQFLVQELSREPEGTPLAELERDTAAMALAASGDHHALESLLVAIKRSGRQGEAAEQALLAHPPAAIEPLFAGGDAVDPRMCDMLGRLGDLRAIAPLRALLSRAAADGSPSGIERATAAARALARLGDASPAPLARQWLASTHPKLRLAGAEVLLLVGARPPNAGSISASLLQGAGAAHGAASKGTAERAARGFERDAAGRLAAREAADIDELETAIELGWQSSDPELLHALSSELERARDPRLRSRLFVALAHTGSERALDPIAAALSRPLGEGGAEAAFALAQAEPEAAGTLLARALRDERTRAIAARAAVVRTLLGRKIPGGLADALETMIPSRDPNARAAAAFGLVALGRRPARSLIESADPVVARAAPRAAPLAGPQALAACAERLGREHDPVTRAALAIALAFDPSYSDALSTGELVSWVESGGMLAPLAAFALGARDGPRVGPSLDSWLAHGDAVLRIAVARGLAYSADPTAAARLSSAYRFEPDPRVRRALVGALAVRREPQRMPPLALAARLDPDRQARTIAERAVAAAERLAANRAAAAQTPTIADLAGSAAAPRPWRTAPPRDASSFASLAIVGPAAHPPPPGRLVLADGTVLPVVPDPDGVIVVGGVSPGPVVFEPAFDLASGVARDEAVRHGAAGVQAAEPVR